MLVVAAAAIGACNGDPDGTKFDGIWAGQPSDCRMPVPAELSCDRVIACAIERKWPAGAPALRSSVVFEKPERLRDGTLINYGIGGSIVVFTLGDGTRAAHAVSSTDDCPAY